MLAISVETQGGGIFLLHWYVFGNWHVSAEETIQVMLVPSGFNGMNLKLQADGSLSGEAEDFWDAEMSEHTASAVLTRIKCS